MQGSTVWKPKSVDPKASVHMHQAQRRVPNGGARMHPNPWPNLGIVTTDPDTWIGSALQLEG